MDDDMLLTRISTDPKVMAGKPVIHGTRLTVDYIVGLMGHGATEADIMAEYPGITVDDIRACLVFSSRSLRDVSYVPLSAVSN